MCSLRGRPATFALCLVLLVGCTGPGGDYDLAPVARSSHHPEPDVTESDFLGPIIPSIETPDRSQWGVRPLFITKDRPWHQGDLVSGRERVTSVLAPFIKYHHNPRTRQFRFWPLFWWTKERTVSGGVDFDWMLFPILYYGSTTPTAEDIAAGDKDGWYFALFPVAGQINEFIAYDRFQFFAWPVFQRLTKRVFDAEENFNSILILIGWTTGYPRGGSHRVLPLYYKSVWTYPPYRAPKYPPGTDPSKPLPKYDKRSYLWPFWHSQTLHMDRGPGKETKVTALFPLFRHEVAFDHEFWTILWPLFRYRIEVPKERGNLVEHQETEGGEAAKQQDGEAANDGDGDGDGDADAKDADEADDGENKVVHFLTQLVWKYEKTDDYIRKRLLTFLYADYETLPRDKVNRIDSMAILQPIGYWKRTVQEVEEGIGGFRDRSYWVLAPFFQTHHRTWLDKHAIPDGNTGRFTKLWPLFSYERDDKYDIADFHTLSLLPLRLEKFVADFNETWGFLWNIYHYRREGTMTRHEAVFELFKAYHDDEETLVSIPLLYTYRSVPDGSNRLTTHNVLWGLLGFERTEGPADDEVRLKLLFLPIPIG